jgi:hypothetical protein
VGSCSGSSYSSSPTATPRRYPRRRRYAPVEVHAPRRGGRTVGTRPRWIRTETINLKSIRTQQPFVNSKKKPFVCQITILNWRHVLRSPPRALGLPIVSITMRPPRASSTFTPRPAHKSASAPLRPPTFPLPRAPRSGSTRTRKPERQCDDTHDLSVLLLASLERVRGVRDFSPWVLAAYLHVLSYDSDSHTSLRLHPISA